MFDRTGVCSYCGREDVPIRTEVQENPGATVTRSICEGCVAGRKVLAASLLLAGLVCFALVFWFAFSR